jgi:AcrR family transcriptional regulator
MTRASVLQTACALGSIEGLHALSIGRLASESGLSKSGVAGHFASKEQMQLAAVQAAVSRFREEVWEPVSGSDPGLTRLRLMMESWLSYLERDVFPGGCFLTSVSLEFDDRPGMVRDAISAAWQGWLELIEREAATAQRRGELGSDLSSQQIAFQLHAYVSQGNWAKQLLRRSNALESSRSAITRLLGAQASTP